MARCAAVRAFFLCVISFDIAFASLRLSHHGADVGANGLLGLPAVAKMMNASSQTLDKMSKHLAELGSKAAEAARSQRDELAQKKESYEQHLEDQQAVNDELKHQNAETSSKIQELEKTNDGLMDKAHKLQNSNAKLRTALETVIAKSDAAENFLKSSLDITNDAHAASLDIIGKQATEEDTSKDTKDDDADNEEAAGASDADTDGDTSTSSVATEDGADAATDASDDSSPDAGEDGVALVEVVSHHRLKKHAGAVAFRSFGKIVDDKEDEETDAQSDDTDSESTSENDEAGAEADDSPEEDMASNSSSAPVANFGVGSNKLIGSLQKELQQLAQQSEASTEEMDSLYQAKHKKIALAKSKILVNQKALNHTRATLMTTERKLKAAIVHLEGTKSKLQKKMKGVGRYFSTLAEFVLKPSVEAEKLIPTLTNNVAGFVESHAKIDLAATPVVSMSVSVKREHVTDAKVSH